MTNEPNEPLSVPLQRRSGWGMSTEGVSRVLYPRSPEEVVQAFEHASAKGWTVAFWGGGRSYGDAALNESHLLLDFLTRCLQVCLTTG